MGFVSEEIRPNRDALEIGGAAEGEPGLPRRFTWRDANIEVAEVLESWKTTGLDRGEAYVRRHWFRIRSTDARTMRIYFERQARRWWLYTIDEDG